MYTRLKISRVGVSRREGDISLLDMHHVVGSESGVERFFERHEVRLFTHEQYLSAFTARGARQRTHHRAASPTAHLSRGSERDACGNDRFRR